MTDLTVYTEATNLTVEVNGNRLTYRDVGPRSGTPIVLLNHWGATLDDYDPLIVATLAKEHRVVATNYVGVGRSTGSVRTTVAAMADDFVAVLDALHITKAHVFGFSLGGFVAQDVAVRWPERVQTLTLAGTGPAGGYKIGGGSLWYWFALIFKSIFTFEEPKRNLFFAHTKQGKRESQVFIKRTLLRKKNRDGAMSLFVMLKQAIAITRWGKQKPQNLTEKLTMPVLVANGDQDLMVDTRNSVDIQKRVRHAKLILYDHAGHGGIFQNADDFAQQVLQLVDGKQEQ